MREPEKVMRLDRLGSMHPCRLSFMRVLTRRMAQDRWKFFRQTFEFDSKCVGQAVYVAQGPHHSYSLVAFGHDLPPEKRSDRVIATAWDATFTLFDGIPSKSDLDRLSANIPLQEAGRVNEKSLTVSRANRSVRLWEHFVQALASGRQPDAEKVKAVGYLMRTTAVYGSGKLGAADYETIAERPEMSVPFQAEMLSVYLTRTFVRDLVQHMARTRGGHRAVDLDPKIARRLGIGNSTGLGMGPFMINHPVLFNNWIQAREEAVVRVRSLAAANEDVVKLFLRLLDKEKTLIANWRSEHPVQVAKLTDLKQDLKAVENYLADINLFQDYPWDRLISWSETQLSLEGQELLVSLIMEPYGTLVDELASSMADKAQDWFQIDGAMNLAKVRSLLKQCFGELLDLDWKARENCARAWYISAEKLEPRLGERFEEPVADYEQPLAPARDGAAALVALDEWDDQTSVAEFLLHHPEHRHTIRRAQIHARAPYGEIRDNTIASDMLPINLLRAKLAFFGATHFDPRSDRWIRICMYANAPYPEELTTENADLWPYEEVPI